MTSANWYNGGGGDPPEQTQLSLPIPAYLQPPPSTTGTGAAATTGAAAQCHTPHSARSDRSAPVGIGGIPTESQLVLLCLDYLRDLRRSYTPAELKAAEGIDAHWLSLAVYGLSRSLVGNDENNENGSNGNGGGGGADLRSPFLTGSGGSGNDPAFDAGSTAVALQRSPMHEIRLPNVEGDGSDGEDGKENNTASAGAAPSPSTSNASTSKVLLVPSCIEDVEREILYTRDPNALLSPADSNDDDGDDANNNKNAASLAAALVTTPRNGPPPTDPAHWYQPDDGHSSNLERFYPLNGLGSDRLPLTLGEIASAGLTGLGARSRIDAERDMVRSDLFGQFLTAVRDKGFFDGTVVGVGTTNTGITGTTGTGGNGNGQDSDIGHDATRTVWTLATADSQRRYEDRYRKVVAKFRCKLAAKAGSGQGPGGGATAGTSTGPGGAGGGSIASGVSEGGSVVSAAAVDAAERQRRRRQRRIDGVRNKKVGSKDGDRWKEESPSAAAATAVAAAAAPRRAAVSPMSPSASSNVSASFNQADIDEAERLKSTGNSYMQQKEYDKAVDSYTAALKIVPNGPGSHVYYSNRAAALLSMKRFEDAIKDSERSLALLPDYGKAHARLGLAQFLLGRYDEAVVAYEVALQLDPDNKASKTYLEKARKKLAAQKVVERKSPRGNAGGRSQFATSVPLSSSTKTQAQIKMDEKEANQCKSKGNTLMASRDYEGAVKEYTTALRLSPEGPNSHIYYSNRAAALCYMERYSEAEIDSETSVKLKPDYGKGYARLGLSRFFLQDYEGAVLAYQDALKYDPDNPASRSYLAKAMRKLQDDVEGE